MKTAEEMGLTLSAAINGLLRKFIAEKRVEFRTPEIPNARTRKNIEEAHKMIKSGKYKVFTNHEDFEKYLLS